MAHTRTVEDMLRMESAPAEASDDLERVEAVASRTKPTATLSTQVSWALRRRARVRLDAASGDECHHSSREMVQRRMGC
jgi:hypothetical protein